MDLSILIYLSSGLFLGWSLGANDAANVFGTAVGSRMVRFTTAALISAVFILLGAVISGAGAAHGLGTLGNLNALAGAFTAAFAAALTVYGMTRLELPVSTTQAIVGAIVGWNWFSGSLTDMAALSKIVGTWIAAPILGAGFAVIIYVLTTRLILWAKIHLLRLDAYTRIGLILAGAFGAYSLGANNIANVMGVFVSSSPFTDFQLPGDMVFTSVQQLFLMGAVAIGVGVFTYSKRVMMTVGNSLMPLTPVGAWVVVVAQSVVLFLFASTSLEHTLIGLGLPTIPLIPVSSSQAVVGAVVGIGLLHGIKGAKQIRWSVLGGIGAGWIATPVVAALICFVALFFMQNVFNQQVYKEVIYALDEPTLDYLKGRDVAVEPLTELKDKPLTSAVAFRNEIRKLTGLDGAQEGLVIAAAEVFEMAITQERYALLDRPYLNAKQVEAIRKLMGERFRHRWQLEEALARLSEDWKPRPATKLNKLYNKALKERLSYVENRFHIESD